MAPRAKARALVVLVLLDAAEPRRAVECAHRRVDLAVGDVRRRAPRPHHEVVDRHRHHRRRRLAEGPAPPLALTRSSRKFFGKR